MTNTTEAIEVVERIRELVSGNQGGYDDPVARRQARTLIAELRVRCPSEWFPSEASNSLLHWVGILYSHRKHAAWGGPDVVRSFVLADCSRIDKVILHWQMRTAEEKASSR